MLLIWVLTLVVLVIFLWLMKHLSKNHERHFRHREHLRRRMRGHLGGDRSQS